MTTLRVTSWNEFTLINRILQIRFSFFYFWIFMQQIFNLIINIIIVESSLINNFFEIFHFAENDIESMSTRKFSSKINWILSLWIINFSINTLIIYLINETSIIEKIILCETQFKITSRIELKRILINWMTTSELIEKLLLCSQLLN
jgi:hypothetical protein